jgi:murein L,D-transpeptidase YcbB/YkuD
MSRWVTDLGMSEEEQAHLRQLLDRVTAATGRVRHWPDQQLARLLEHGRALNDWPLLITTCASVAKKATLKGVSIRSLEYFISATEEIDTGRRPTAPRARSPRDTPEHDNSMSGWTPEAAAAVKRMQERFKKRMEE